MHPTGLETTPPLHPSFDPLPRLSTFQKQQFRHLPRTLSSIPSSHRLLSSVSSIAGLPASLPVVSSDIRRDVTPPSSRPSAEHGLSPLSSPSNLTAMSYTYPREVSPVALHHGYLSPPTSSYQEEEDRPLRHSDSMSTLRTISSASSTRL